MPCQAPAGGAFLSVERGAFRQLSAPVRRDDDEVIRGVCIPIQRVRPHQLSAGDIRLRADHLHLLTRRARKALGTATQCTRMNDHGPAATDDMMSDAAPQPPR
jgi:hypothetical protein